MVAVEAAGSTVGTVAVAVVGLVPEAVTILVPIVVSAIVGTTVGTPGPMVTAAAAVGNPLAAITPLEVRAALRAAGEVEGKGENIQIQTSLTQPHRKSPSTAFSCTLVDGKSSSSLSSSNALAS